MFTLPAGYLPAHSLILSSDGSTGVIIAGPGGLTEGAITLPPGSVAPLGGAGGGVNSLDGITFEPVGSKVALARHAAPGGKAGIGLLGLLR